MKNTMIRLSMGLLLTLFAIQVHAAITLKNVAETEVTEVDEKGKKKVKRVPAGKVIPGTVVIYTITASNTSDKNADNVVINNPVPEQMTYVDGSAFGAGTDVTFSVDGGNNYAKPNKLTIKDKDGKDQPATAEDYTNVRWKLNFTLKPGQEAAVWYRAKVK